MGHAELEPEDIDASISPLSGALKRTLSAFCTTSSIHGLKYVRDEDTNRIVRFIWMLITLVMFICAIIMVITFYIDYRSNPTRMNVANDHAPIESLYFPAVTVCPEIFYNVEQSTRFLETLTLPASTSVRQVLDSLSVSYGFLNDDERYTAQDVQLLQQLLQLNNLTVPKFVQGLRWQCADILFRCRYQGRQVDCAQLFQLSRTFYGYCCSFNLNQTGLRYTRRYARAGLMDGLSLILYHNDRNFDYKSTYSHGFKLLLSPNNAFPSAHAVGKFVALNEEVFVAIRPIETFCSRAVRSLSVEERQCVLPHEFELTHFPAYVGVNCELNCRVSNMVKFCGCMTFFFDNNRTDDRVCEYKDIPCLVENFADILGRFRNTQCACPNNCESIDYNVELTSAHLQLDIPTINTFYDDIKKDYAVVHIFFNSQVYRRVRRDLLSNMVTLVSNLGSAFSLFVGMSMVSAVEIIYYFTVILRKYYKQELKAREKILLNKKSKESVDNELDK